jgi:hypothetical protein
MQTALNLALITYGIAFAVAALVALMIKLIYHTVRAANRRKEGKP